MNLHDYNHIIVAFSGGKDSTACYLHLLEAGIPPERIELWHHLVDGREGSTLMDWHVTEDYCRQFATELGSPIYFSWKVGGFEGEMLRENALTQSTRFETPEGEIRQVGGVNGKQSTRLKFPQVSPNLSIRWCSAYLKIDICATAIRNQERFNNAKTLVVSGERGEESAARAKYAEFEPDRSDNREGRKARHVDRWRPIKNWSEKEVWALIKRYRVNPHPAYRAGWGRVSCAACIFGNANQFASVKRVAPDQFENVAEYEELFGLTIKRDVGLRTLAAKGEAYSAITPERTALLNSTSYRGEIFTSDWRLPAGAFGESCGPI